MMNQMIEKLFEDIPYSEFMDEVKTRIKNKLQQEYEKEREILYLQWGLCHFP